MKMRGVILLSVFVLSLSPAFAQGQTYPWENTEFARGPEGGFIFAGGKFTYINYYFEQYGKADFGKTESGPCTISQASGFIVADADLIDGQHRIFVFPGGRNMIIYDSKLQKTMIGRVGGGEATLLPFGQASATSEFRETLGGKEVTYRAANLTDFDITNPWVEGVSGPGTGERLELSGLGDRVNNLVILNGFFSPTKPQLYQMNNRLKAIIIRGYDNRNDLVLEKRATLVDEPVLQMINLPGRASKFEIEIVDVYKGSIYDDTCLSAVFVDTATILRQDAN